MFFEARDRATGKGKRGKHSKHGKGKSFGKGKGQKGGFGKKPLPPGTFGVYGSYMNGGRFKMHERAEASTDMVTSDRDCLWSSFRLAQLDPGCGKGSERSQEGSEGDGYIDELDYTGDELEDSVITTTASTARTRTSSIPASTARPTSSTMPAASARLTSSTINLPALSEE